MGKPVICYDSILNDTGATVTATVATASGYSLDNLSDFKSYTFWKSAVTTTSQFIDIDLGGNTSAADYVALVNNTMATEASTLTVYADTFTPPTTSRASGTIDTTGVWVLLFTSPGAFRYWRIGLTSMGGFNEAPTIGQLMLGERTTLPQFLSADWDPYFEQYEVAGSRSEGGHALGATIRGKRHRGTISFGPAGTPRADYTNTINPFLENHAARRRPFIFITDPDDTNTLGNKDIAIARYIKATDGSDIGRRAVAGTWANIELSMDVEEAFMEPVS